MSTQPVLQPTVDHDELPARFDLWLIGATVSLLGLGLVMVASASISTAERDLGEPLHYLWRQSSYLLAALLAGGLAFSIPVKVWCRAGVILLVVAACSLCLVFVPGIGHTVNGSARWITLGAFNFQPSETAKLFFIVYLAGYLVRHGDEVRGGLRGFIKPLLVLSGLAALLLLEPDYGASVVMFCTALGMLFLAGVPLLTFIASGGVVALGLATLLVAAPYRVERLTSFVDPWSDPFGSGFQLTQALIAIGRGEWLGVGLGASVQKLFYLPEAHTDFLFSVMAEELGLLGMCTVIALFTLIVWRAFRIATQAANANKLFSAYLAYGIGLLIGLQAFVNIGVNMGILPTKGLTLPLMSYGGSSLVSNCVAVALLLRVDRELRAES